MKNIFTVILVLLTTIKLRGQESSLPLILNGVEIFLLKTEYINRTSWENLPDKELKQVVKKYDSLRDFPDSTCVNFVDYKNVKLNVSAFLDTSDIAYYSWNDETIVLTEKGMKKLSAFNIRISGEPFVIVLNNKRLFAAWFWSRYSSEVPYRVYTQVVENSKKLKLHPPLCGKDPRNNKELLNELKKLNK